MRTEIGEISVQSDAEPLQAGRKRGDLGAARGRRADRECAAGENVWQGAVDQKVFLGEAIDFRVAVGARSLLSRQHPTLRTPVGGAIFVHINPEKCRVFAAD